MHKEDLFQLINDGKLARSEIGIFVALGQITQEAIVNDVITMDDAQDFDELNDELKEMVLKGEMQPAEALDIS